MKAAALRVVTVKAAALRLKAVALKVKAAALRVKAAALRVKAWCGVVCHGVVKIHSTWRAVWFLKTLMSQELASKPSPDFHCGGGLLVSGIVIETREESFIHTIARVANGARV